MWTKCSPGHSCNYHFKQKYGGVEVYRYAWLASAVDGGGWSGLLPGCFATWERAPRLSPRMSFDVVRKKEERKKKLLSVPRIEV